MSVVIYHNSRCSKSRQTLQLLQERGIKPEVVDYLAHPPSREILRAIIQQLAITPRELMRKQEPEYKALQLDNPALTDEELISAMLSTPKLIERPLVTVNGKAAIGRPPEAVLTIL